MLFRSVDQPPALWQLPGDGLANPPDRAYLREDDIGQLTLRRDTHRQGRPERNPCSDTADRPMDGQSGYLERAFPRVRELPTRQARRVRRARQGQAPALARRRRKAAIGRGSSRWPGVHV